MRVKVTLLGLGLIEIVIELAENPFGVLVRPIGTIVIPLGTIVSPMVQ